MSLLPLVGKDPIVGHHGLFDPIGHCQNLLTTLLSVCLNPEDLCPMGIPLPLCVINLEKNVSRATKRPYICFSHPGFQLHNLG